MKIVFDTQGDYPDSVTSHSYDTLKQYSKQNDKEALFCGYSSTSNKSLLEEYSRYNSKIYLNLATPCEFQSKDEYGRDAFEQVKYFDKIYTICPYTIKWHREILGDKRYYYIFHPFPGEYYAPQNYNKKYDVCYFGGVYGNFHEQIVEAMSKFDYRLISRSPFPGVTDLNVSHKQKIDIISQCKVSICCNLLPVKSEQAHSVMNYNGWQKNKAFDRVFNGIMPQYKCRAAEAAFCKSLLLVKKDPWNLIEHYFLPDKEFLYYENKNDLEDKLRYILNNYSKFSSVIDNAYKRSLNYTAKPLFDIIKSGVDWKHL
tara:strand:+ start:1429 stop:2370 length:942 start_codon:yes stop_codon:yes gene_type:complete